MKQQDALLKKENAARLRAESITNVPGEDSAPEDKVGDPVRCCCCLPCNHCRNWTWVVEEILAYGDRLRSTRMYVNCSIFIDIQNAQ